MQMQSSTALEIVLTWLSVEAFFRSSSSLALIGDRDWTHASVDINVNCNAENWLHFNVAYHIFDNLRAMD
ncbi:hypothetical protein QYF36_023097 [Acer negundo]|nr:hypothetical protein QYF36_023097 [Acer negundo]